MERSRHSQLFDTLLCGIRQLTTSERWCAYLRLQARFHDYSFGNVLLIAAQCPQATQVAGFRRWQELGRHVRRGEHALWILAPVRARPARREVDSGSRARARAETGPGTGAGTVDAETEEGQPAVRSVLCGFRWVAVFDVSQTEGAPLPSVCTRLEGDNVDHHFRALVAVAASIGFRVEDHDFPGETNGDCSHARRRIRIERRNAGTQRVKTLAHELAHALLHEEVDRRDLAEVEAESVAYVVCQAIGIDSADFSFGYVANWAGSGEQAIHEIRTAGQRIQGAAATILEHLGVADGGRPAPASGRPSPATDELAS